MTSREIKMKTAMVNGERVSIEYSTGTDIRTKASFDDKTFGQGLSCDVYNTEDGKHKVLVLNSVNGDILKSTTVLSLEEYEAISDLYDVYAGGRYHTACLEACGAENHLHLQ